MGIIGPSRLLTADAIPLIKKGTIRYQAYFGTAPKYNAILADATAGGYQGIELR